MRPLLKIMAAITVATSAFLPAALVNAADGARHTPASDMKAQHHTMETIDREWRKIGKALENKDAAAGVKAADTILRVAPNIEKFMPHRNPDKRDRFMDYYGMFLRQLIEFRTALAQGNIVGASAISGEAEKTCGRCHALFR